MLSNVTTLIIVSGCAWLVMLFYLSSRSSNLERQLIPYDNTSYYFNGSQMGKIKVPRKLQDADELLLSFSVKNSLLTGTLASIKIGGNFYTIELDQQNTLTLVVKQPFGPASTIITLDNLQVQKFINVSIRLLYHPDTDDDSNQVLINLHANDKGQEVVVSNIFKVPKYIYLANSTKPGPKRPFRGVFKNIFVNQVPITGEKIQIVS